ncbi:MAG: glycosyltransferase [Bacteroidales bacterium]|nr:glycosyltransferase [Bacteroidales bacterium]
MTKILRILNRFNVGGPTYNAAYLTKYISDDFETVLIGGLKEPDEASSEYVLKNLEVDYLLIPEIQRGISLTRDFKAFRKVVKIIKQEKPDIVHTHASKAGMIGRAAAIYCGVPQIYHTFHGHVFHSYFGKAKTKFFILIERFLASKTTAIIAISNIQKHELSDIYKICSPNKIEVVPLGFDLQKFYENQEEKRREFRSKYSIADDEIAIGIVGRLASIKNHQLFINAIAECSKQANEKKIRAFIIGDGELNEQLQAYCKNKNITYSNTIDNTHNNLITFTSWIKEVDVAYAGLDIVALTSFNEGTPVSLIEAQAAGRPIVSTNVGGVSDIVLENKTALLSTLDENDFSSKLLKLILDDNLRIEMSKNCAEFSDKKFSYTRLCSDMENVYKKHSLTK